MYVWMSLPDIDALQPGDKLVAIAGENVKGYNVSTVKKKIDKLFTKEILRCQKTHCQVKQFIFVTPSCRKIKHLLSC